MGDGNSFPLVVWLLLVILACKSIVLCKCSGKYIDIYFSLKITYLDLPFLRRLTFYYGYIIPGSSRYQQSWATSLCCQQFFSLNSRRSPRLLFYRICYALFKWRHLLALSSLPLGVLIRFLRICVLPPLNLCSLSPYESLSKTTLFLVSLATAKRASELQPLSNIVSFSSEGAVVSYVPEFLDKTESALRPLPRSFLVKFLTDFAAGLDEDLLSCSVRCLRVYLERTAPGVNKSSSTLIFVTQEFHACDFYIKNEDFRP